MPSISCSTGSSWASVAPATDTSSTGCLVVARAEDTKGYGWGSPERVHGRVVRWMNGREADLYLACDEPLDRTLEITCAPLLYPFRQQNVGVFINRRYAGEWVCPHKTDFRSYLIEIPADYWIAGTNTLTLRVGYLKRNPPDRREMGLSVQRIRWWPR